MVGIVHRRANGTMWRRQHEACGINGCDDFFRRFHLCFVTRRCVLPWGQNGARHGAQPAVCFMVQAVRQKSI